MKKIAPHPLTSAVPDMTDEEYAALRDSISDVGQKKAIVLFEGKILDGRHRYQACLDLGLKPRLEVYRGSKPREEIIIPSLTHRNLTPAQKAATMIALRNTTWGGDRKSAEADQTANWRFDSEDVAKVAGVSERTVERVSKVAQESPELLDKIKEGEITPHAATQELKQQEAAEQAEDEEILDSTGYPVPKALVPVWLRKNEILDFMRKIAVLEATMTKAQTENDPLYIGFKHQDVILRLKDIHSELRHGQLYAVCVTCNGRNYKSCKLCKGRGILSRFAWNTYVPQEAKDIRKANAK